MAAKKKTGLKKKYIKLAGKGGFKKAWSLQKSAERKQAAARKKPASKKPARKKIVRKPTVKKVVRKKTVRKKPVRKTVRKKVVRRKTPIKRKGPSMAARKKKTSTRRKRRNNPRINIQKTLTDGAMAAAGAIGASAIANMIPVPDPRIKALIPIAAAIILPTTKLVRGDMGRALSMGMLTIGALSLVRQFAPQLPLLAGENDMLDYVPGSDEEAAMLGYNESDLDDDLMLGEVVDVAGESVDIAGENFITMDDV